MEHEENRVYCIHDSRDIGRDGGNRTSRAHTLSVPGVAQVVSPSCCSLPKPMYNVTDKQVDHSSLFFIFLFFPPLLSFNFNFYILFYASLAPQRSVVGVNDPTPRLPTSPIISLNLDPSFSCPTLPMHYTE